VFDRLFSSLGQDALESMYWNTVNRPRSSRMVVSVAVVWVYAVLHSLLLFGHVATLNVAMNSADQALLTLLISGNFAEIKSTVFKKYNKPALFKITASDICERFKLGLFLSLVMLLNVCQGMDKSQKFDYARICGYVWCAELLSDWIKHSFITKFNFLPSRVYPEYALLLAGDVTGIGHEGVNLDHSHAVVKRIGFAQIPLVCVMFRMLREAYKYAVMSPVYEETLKGRPLWFVSTAAVGGWLFLLTVKMALGILLQRASLAKLQAAPQVIVMDQSDKKKK
jgi:Eukaryotic membrane protein family